MGPEAQPEPSPQPAPQPAPTQTPPEGGSCTGEPCVDPTHCRSKWGSCGSSSAYCNAESTWTPTGCSSPDAAQGSLHWGALQRCLSLPIEMGSLWFDCCVLQR